MTALEAAERIVAGEWRREQRRRRGREVVDEILVGLMVLAACVAVCVWLIGAVYTVRLLIGAFS